MHTDPSNVSIDVFDNLEFFMANVFIDYSGTAVQGVEKG